MKIKTLLLGLAMLLASTHVLAARPQPNCNPGMHFCACDPNIPYQCDEMRKQCIEPIDCGEYGCSCHTARVVGNPGPVPGTVVPPRTVPPMQPMPMPVPDGRRVP